MKKIHVDGINGYIEANNKYVIVVVGRKDGSLLKEHVVFHNEIEDIIYKKPTREKYGFITLYLSTKSYVLNEKIKYTLILDKIDQKNLESNKKIFDFIRSIIKNKKVEVQEVVDITEEEEKKEEKPKEEKPHVGVVSIIDTNEKKDNEEKKKIEVIIEKKQEEEKTKEVEPKKKKRSNRRTS